MKISWSVLSIFLVTTRIAGADPAAEKLFRDGRAWLKAGKLAEACDAFERSDQLEPRIGTMLNLGDCRERQGRTATAWALFLEAKARAAPSKDVRGDVAKQRAASLEPRLAYLTIRITPEQAIDGLVIKRNGIVVPSSAWNTALPLDPTDYTIEATAPRHDRWSITEPLKPRDRITVTVGPLAATATTTTAAPKEPPVEVATTKPPAEVLQEVVARPVAPLDPIAPRYHLAVGLALGVAAGATSSAPPSNPDVLEDDRLPIGARVLGSLPIPHGAVRAIGSVLYTKGLNDKTDSTNTKKLYVIGLAADYVWMPSSKLGFAAGLGIGWDYEVRSDDQGSDTAQWTTLRVSPIIVRLAEGRVELGVHTQLLRRGDDTGFIGVAAIDVFLW